MRSRSESDAHRLASAAVAMADEKPKVSSGLRFIVFVVCTLIVEVILWKAFLGAVRLSCLITKSGSNAVLSS